MCSIVLIQREFAVYCSIYVQLRSSLTNMCVVPFTQILLHFGTQTEEGGGGPEYPVMDKLNQRMAKVNDRKKK